ncbi:hypothetical protein [Campylobacter suis]|uniref:Tetratricopeptide repeat protein n=1 Tax=Campylobacter suis TaxID=2790657 RepID=A0ABM8Q2Z9_9BACT|nr:hypothetical protein [Campylobacter suis]CAD7287213.1 hypothetical protein LMG8286_00844 [Campylobacter suis]
MRAKNLALILGISIVLLFSFFFATNGSYQLSFKARFYESIGNYEQALQLSKEALSIDAYNKMATATHANATNSLKFVTYISQGNEYLSKIRAMSDKGVSKADRERIKIMCEIMIDDFVTLTSVYTRDDELRQNAKDMYENFLKLKSELFKD